MVMPLSGACPGGPCAARARPFRSECTRPADCRGSGWPCSGITGSWLFAGPLVSGISTLAYMPGFDTLRDVKLDLDCMALDVCHREDLRDPHRDGFRMIVKCRGVLQHASSAAALRQACRHIHLDLQPGHISEFERIGCPGWTVSPSSTYFSTITPSNGARLLASRNLASIAQNLRLRAAWRCAPAPYACRRRTDRRCAPRHGHADRRNPPPAG